MPKRVVTSSKRSRARLCPTDAPKGPARELPRGISATAINLFVRLGKVPSMEGWLPGDVVLTQPTGAARGVAAFVIRHTQREAYPDGDDAEWTHAALYIGDGRVIESTKATGTAVQDLMVRTNSQVVLFRRHPELSEAAGSLLVSGLDEYLGAPYATSHLLAVGKALRQGKMSAPPEPTDDDGRICSELVAAIFADAFGLSVCPEFRVDELIPPAALSFTRGLGDVESCWWELQDRGAGVTT